MTFQPVVPLSGYSGWRFLVQTMDSQKTAFVESAPVARATTYFRENISSVRTAEDLVNDRRLLGVALGAFGLDADIDSKAFIRKVLEGGTLSDGALSNRLTEKRYAAFASAFGFGDFGARTGLSVFPDEILRRYEARSFETAVGEQDSDMRLALGLSDGLRDIVAGSSNANAQWYGIMGNKPLRTVFETALGLPTSFGQIDIDKQLETFQSRAKATLGSDLVADFSDPELQERIIRLYLVRAEAQASTQTSGFSIALQLLQS